MKIAIRFGDNDFWLTFIETLKLFNNYIKTTMKTPSKEEVVEFLNNNLTSVYWVKQNKYEYNLDWDAESYLKIKRSQVFFDDEADYIIETDFLNGEIFILDTETNRVYTK